MGVKYIVNNMQSSMQKSWSLLLRLLICLRSSLDQAPLTPTIPLPPRRPSMTPHLWRHVHPCTVKQIPYRQYLHAAESPLPCARLVAACRLRPITLRTQ